MLRVYFLGLSNRFINIPLCLRANGEGYGEEIVCVREDNALAVERVAEWDRTDKR